MIRESDVAALLIGIAVLAFTIHHCTRLRAIPAFNTMFAGFVALLIGWLLSTLEEIDPSETLSLLKHLSNAIGGVAILLWCRRALRKEGQR